VFEALDEKALGPDNFIGLFYKRSWDIVKLDLLDALHQLFNLRINEWNLLKSSSLYWTIDTQKKRELVRQRTIGP